jgi:nicotinate phosphoribosyltransferase
MDTDIEVVEFIEREEMILKSMLDTDLYKLSMQQAILELYPATQVEYRFYNRRPSDTFGEKFVEALKAQILEMASLGLTSDEAIWLAKTCPYLKPAYIEYLRNYRYKPDEVSVKDEDGQLVLSIVGPWHSTVLWEVPLMATISELYFQFHSDWNYDGQARRAIDKARRLSDAGCYFADFGTRRRRSYETQSLVVHAFSPHKSHFVGTSNPYLAMTFGTKPIGTQAHEWIQAHSVLGSLRHANLCSMDAWVDVYNSQLGIALTDTYGLDSFFSDFDSYHTRLWDGIRHDSGCPFEFALRAAEHYKKFGVYGKTLIFSDNLDVDKAIAINEHCKILNIRCSFGIGTHFTNDFEGLLKALNMVIKLWSVDGIPVVKLGEPEIGKPSKTVGDKDAVRVALWTHYGVPLDETK